jgi:GAF domain-containing protein/HAMP domain-containing protein
MDQEARNKMNRPTSFLANISVNWKLNVIVAVMIIGLLGAFLLGIVGMRTIQSSMSLSYEKVLNSNIATSQLSELFFVMQTNLEALQNPALSLNDQQFHRGAMNNAKVKALDILDTYEEDYLPVNNPLISSISQTSDLLDLQDQEEIAILSLQRTFDQYLVTDQQYQELFETGIRNEYFASTMKSRLGDTQQSLSQLVEVNNKYTEAYREEAISSYQDTVGYMAIALVLTIAVGWLIANAITRSIGRRLEDLEQSASLIEEEYTDLRFTFTVEGKDEIAKLGNTFNRMTKQLQNSLIELEDRVQERTAELADSMQVSERRAQQFEAIALVSSAISSIRSLDEVLPRVTELISKQFGYYHTGIFLIDANNEYAILSAANSEGGQRMLNRGHQLKVGEQGIVGYATGTGKPRIALDVGEDAVYFDNPDMPDTRSEMALPLRIGENIVGALDVQSTEAAAFSEEDINVLSLLADQVSLAIENARLFDQARKSLAESEALYRQYLRQAWTRLPKEQNLTGFQYNARGSAPIEAKPEVGSTNTGVQEEENKIHSPSLSVPIAIRGETIGTLSVQVPDIKNINEDQKDLVNAVAERVALSAENARLFEETTRRAERERLVSDITVKIRSTNDPEVMVQTALDELKNVLGATKVQLVPHTLEKEESLQELENFTLASTAKQKRKRNEK